MRGTLPSVAAGIALAACGGTLEDPSVVQDLRILAMRADPPEIIVAPDEVGRAALSGYLLSALVADPYGDDHTSIYEWTACPDPGRPRCDGAAGAVEVGRGEFAPSAHGPASELLRGFLPSWEFLRRALEQDPLGGFGGLPILVTLRLRSTDGSEEVVGSKRVLFTVRQVPGQTANLNPFVGAIRLDGEPWREEVPRTLSARSPMRVSAADPAPRAETYVVPDFRGGFQTLKERWTFSFLATAGRFSRHHAGGGTEVVATEPERIESDWAPPGEPLPTWVTFFIVVRDGRGGEGWSVRWGALESAP